MFVRRWGGRVRFTVLAGSGALLALMVGASGCASDTTLFPEGDGRLPSSSAGGADESSGSNDVAQGATASTSEGVRAKIDERVFRAVRSGEARTVIVRLDEPVIAQAGLDAPLDDEPLLDEVSGDDIVSDDADAASFETSNPETATAEAGSAAMERAEAGSADLASPKTAGAGEPANVSPEAIAIRKRAEEVSFAARTKAWQSLAKRSVERHASMTKSLLTDLTAYKLVHQQTYRHLPLIKARVEDLDALNALAGHRSVVHVYEDERFQHTLTQSLALINQPTAALDSRYGQGTAVAVLDTGCDSTRSAFGSCTAPGAAGCKVAYAHDFAPDDASLDDDGHGTNVSAIVLGVAPKTKILALDVFDGEFAYSSAILSAIDWIITNRATYNIAAMNLSLGGGLFTSACSGSIYSVAFTAARNAGVLAAVASGNDGSTSSISSPACATNAVSVGAVYDANVGGLAYTRCTDMTTAADKVTCFSNSASFLSALAPGALVTAGGYTMAGTSQAAPHVAGAMAVLAGNFTTSTPSKNLSRLLTRGKAVRDARNGITKPRIDIAAATCSAIVSATKSLLTANGGTYSVSVKTGTECAWTTSSGNSWLSVAPGLSGTGKVNVVMAPNPGAPRTGFVTVARRKVVFTQNGTH